MASPLQKFIDGIKAKGAQAFNKIKDIFVAPTYRGSVNRATLTTLLNSNVCEIQFVRRRPKRAPHRPSVRYMICTNSAKILRSRDGKISLNFREARGVKINEAKHNMVVVWDVIMQDYRNVPLENCVVINTIPANKFWEFYNNILYPMSRDDKSNYMDR
jgi:hypothetical protein